MKYIPSEAKSMLLYMLDLYFAGIGRKRKILYDNIISFITTDSVMNAHFTAIYYESKNKLRIKHHFGEHLQEAEQSFLDNIFDN